LPPLRLSSECDDDTEELMSVPVNALRPNLVKCTLGKCSTLKQSNTQTFAILYTVVVEYCTQYIVI